MQAHGEETIRRGQLLPDESARATSVAADDGLGETPRAEERRLWHHVPAVRQDDRAFARPTRERRLEDDIDLQSRRLRGRVGEFVRADSAVDALGDESRA